MNNQLKYFFIYKPFGMISQFSPEGCKPVLKDLYNFPSDVYPVGRLDSDSEGLLIITNDTRLNSRLLSPGNSHRRVYLAQVEGVITNEAIHRLSEGVEISVEKHIYKTLPAEASLLDNEPILPERNPPIRFRKSVPVSWLELSVIEGKNRQVRKMTAAVGFPTLRLVRLSIENLSIQGMSSGSVVEISGDELYKLLFNSRKNP